MLVQIIAEQWQWHRGRVWEQSSVPIFIWTSSANHSPSPNAGITISSFVDNHFWRLIYGYCTALIYLVKLWNSSELNASLVINNFAPPLTLFKMAMMTSSNGNIFRVTGPLCRESTGEFPSQRPVTRHFDVFFDLQCFRLMTSSWEMHYLFKKIIFKLVLQIDIKGISWGNCSYVIPTAPIDDKSALAQVMTWCRQTQSRYLSQCWPKSMSPYDVNEIQWFNNLFIIISMHLAGASLPVCNLVMWRLFSVLLKAYRTSFTLMLYFYLKFVFLFTTMSSNCALYVRNDEIKVRNYIFPRNKIMTGLDYNRKPSVHICKTCMIVPFPGWYNAQITSMG